MRAKTAKFCENPFLYAEEGCTLCHVGVLILSTSLAPISKRFFLHWYIVCFCGKGQVEQLFCSINKHGPVGVM